MRYIKKYKIFEMEINDHIRSVVNGVFYDLHLKELLTDIFQDLIMDKDIKINVTDQKDGKCFVSLTTPETSHIKYNEISESIYHLIKYTEDHQFKLIKIVGKIKVRNGSWSEYFIDPNVMENCDKEFKIINIYFRKTTY